MKRFLPGSLTLLAALALSACDRAPTPDPGPSLSGTVSTTPTGSPDAASAVLTGRTLNLYVGVRGWNENLQAPAQYGYGALAVSSAVIGPGQTYTLPLPDAVPATSLMAVTGFWTTNPFVDGTCSVSSEQYSDPAMTLGIGILRVLPGGALTRGIDVGWPLDWRQRSTAVREVVEQALVYADRAGSVTVQYDCVSGFGFRMTSDTRLSLQAGWNVLEKRSVEVSVPEAGRAANAYEFRSRPLPTAGRALAYHSETIFLDVPAAP